MQLQWEMQIVLWVVGNDWNPSRKLVLTLYLTKGMRTCRASRVTSHSENSAGADYSAGRPQTIEAQTMRVPKSRDSFVGVPSQRLQLELLWYHCNMIQLLKGTRCLGLCCGKPEARPVRETCLIEYVVVRSQTGHPLVNWIFLLWRDFSPSSDSLWWCESGSWMVRQSSYLNNTFLKKFELMKLHAYFLLITVSSHIFVYSNSKLVSHFLSKPFPEHFIKFFLLIKI